MAHSKEKIIFALAAYSAICSLAGTGLSATIWNDIIGMVKSGQLPAMLIAYLALSLAIVGLGAVTGAMSAILITRKM